jgi:glycosyltransferase involved in cell wall biosynthesis
MNSILNQTLKDIEIIMVDDGSPDNCPKMCDEYAKKDDRVKVIHKKNGGLGYARNSGLDVATGEYVAFVDSDDFVKENMYEVLYKKVEQYKADTVFCCFYTYYNEHNIQDHKNVNKDVVFEGKGVIDFALDFVGSSPDERRDWKYEKSVWHSLYNNSILKNYHIRFRSEREILSEDIVFQELYLPFAKKVIYIPDSLYYYFLGNESSLTSAKYDSTWFTRVVALYNSICDLTKNIDPKGFRAQRQLIAYMRYNAYRITDSDHDYNKKIYYLNELSGKEIWSKISFPLTSLNLHSFIIAFLQKHSINNVLLMYLKMIRVLRRILKK